MMADHMPDYLTSVMRCVLRSPTKPEAVRVMHRQNMSELCHLLSMSVLKSTSSPSWDLSIELWVATRLIFSAAQAHDCAERQSGHQQPGGAQCRGAR